MNSTGTPGFWALYRQLPKKVREAAQAAYELFQQNPAHPSLRFHRLDYDPRFWSVRVTRDFRAVGAVEGNDIVWFWIGGHEDFDREFPA